MWNSQKLADEIGDILGVNINPEKMGDFVVKLAEERELWDGLVCRVNATRGAGRRLSESTDFAWGREPMDNAQRVGDPLESGPKLKTELPVETEAPTK